MMSIIEQLQKIKDQVLKVGIKYCQKAKKAKKKKKKKQRTTSTWISFQQLFLLFHPPLQNPATGRLSHR